MRLFKVCILAVILIDSSYGRGTPVIGNSLDLHGPRGENSATLASTGEHTSRGFDRLASDHLEKVFKSSWSEYWSRLSGSPSIIFDLPESSKLRLRSIVETVESRSTSRSSLGPRESLAIHAVLGILDYLNYHVPEAILNVWLSGVAKILDSEVSRLPRIGRHVDTVNYLEILGLLGLSSDPIPSRLIKIVGTATKSDPERAEIVRKFHKLSPPENAVEFSHRIDAILT